MKILQEIIGSGTDYSNLLKNVLRRYLKWAEADAQEDGEFNPSWGLCANMPRTLDHFLSSRLQQTTGTDWSPFEWYPGAYNEESRLKTHHANPKRLAWIKQELESSMIFVFGSNLAGVHGAGAARYAMQSEGAVFGVGEGLTGNSYALPTKNRSIRTLPLGTVESHVKTFLEHARTNPQNTYKVTRIGCGLAGFSDEQIAPMFTGAPINCYFDAKWKDFLHSRANYWGSM